MITRVAIDLLIEALVCVTVGNVDQSLFAPALAGDAFPHGNPDVCIAGGHLGIELLVLCIVKEDRSPVGLKHLARRHDDLGEHCIEVGGEAELSCDVQDSP